MTGADHEVRVVPSVLDRLIDEDPKSRRDAPGARAESVRELRRAVQRDLDNLLNSRDAFADLSPDFVEAGQSVLKYGLPDFSTMNLANAPDRNRVRLIIETAIRTFEPRLTGIVVTVAPVTPTDRSLRLRLDARLIVAPSTTPIGFDIRLPPQARTYEVKEIE